MQIFFTSKLQNSAVKLICRREVFCLHSKFRIFLKALTSELMTFDENKDSCFQVFKQYFYTIFVNLVPNFLNLVPNFLNLVPNFFNLVPKFSAGQCSKISGNSKDMSGGTIFKLEIER